MMNIHNYILSGGAWYSYSSSLRSTYHDFYFTEGTNHDYSGFRLITLKLTNKVHIMKTIKIKDIEINMAPIPTGKFYSENDKQDISVDGFQMMETTVSVELWNLFLQERKIIGAEIPDVDIDPWKDKQLPVVNVSYVDIVEDFIPWLNRKTGKTFRLPTANEWEYACRAGTTTKYNTGDTITKEQACFEAKQPVPVKSFKPNNWGLYNMHGNVWEWTSTAY